MTSGYEAALLVLVLLLPGAFAAWGFERHVQRYGRRLKDWFLRLAGLSAVCLAVGAGPLYWLVATYWRDFAEREPLPVWLYLVPGLYLVLPASGGWALGLLVRRSGSPLSRLLGPIRAPSAWDLLFDTRAAGFVSCRLRSGRWVGGLYADADEIRSYVGADGPVQDIYLAHAVEFDQETGSPVRLDGDYVWTGGGILLKWADIESLEFRQVVNRERGRLMARKRRSKRKPPRDRRPTYVGGYSPRSGVGPADVPKDLFRPKTTDELVNGSHS